MLSTSGSLLLLAAAGKVVARWGPKAFEVLTWASFTLGNASILFVPYFIPEAWMRHQWLGTAYMVLKPLPIILCMRRAPYMAFLAMSIILKVASSAVTVSRYGDAFALYAHMPDLFLSLAYISFSHHVHQWMFALYDTQYQLKKEKEAREKSLLGVCDATVWVAEDGNTITQSDPRFDDIVGAPATGTALSHYVLQTPGEQARLREVFEHRPNERHSVPAVALHTTLRNAGLGEVEMLVVDCCSDGARDTRGTRRRGGFFVGVRQHGVEPEPPLAQPVPPPAHPGEGAPAALALDTGAAPAPAAAPGAAGGDSLTSVEERVALPELEEVAVSFELESETMAVRHFAVRFAPQASGLEPPQFAAWLQERVAGSFRTWAQSKVNKAFLPASEDDSNSPPNYGPVALETPFLGGMRLVGETASLEVADFDEDEPLTATLHLGRLWQVQHRRGVRRPPRAGADQAAAPAGRVQL